MFSVKILVRSIADLHFLEKNARAVYDINVNGIRTLAQIIGSLGFLLYGMKLMSGGIQKSAGEQLQSVLSFMTGN